MGSFLSIPILALAAIIQSTLAPQMQIMGGRPDFVFLLVLSWSINARLEEGVVWAFVGGIMQDLFSVLPVGTSTLGMIPVVFGVSSLGKQVYRVGFILLTGLVIGGTLFKIFIQIVILLFTGHRLTLFNIGYVAAPTLFYNLIFIWPIYWFVRWIQRRLGEY